MRRLLLLGLCLAVIASGIHAEDEIDEKLNLEDQEVEFQIPTFQDDEGEEEEGRALTEAGKAIDPKDLARYNSFIDTLFKRINSYTRSRQDPLRFVIKKKAGEKGNKGNKGNKGKKAGKSEKKKANKKSGTRRPRGFDMGDDDAVGQEDAVEKQEEETKESRDVGLVYKEVEVEEVEADDDDDNEEAEAGREKRDVEENPQEEAANRKGKPARGNKNRKQNNDNNNNNNNRSGNKSGNGKNKNKKNKGGKKDEKKGGRKDKKKGDKKRKQSTRLSNVHAYVSGLATLARTGDVTVTSNQKGKLIKADFRLGPIELKVSRKFGKGKTSLTKNARATTPQLDGKIAIRVSTNGKAKVSAFKVMKPSIVRVDGNLNRNDKGSSKNNFMENSIGKFSPVAAQKLKLASRAVLKAAEPKAAETKA